MMTTNMQRRETRTLPDGRFAVLTFEVEVTNHSYFAWQVSVMRSEQAWRDGENEGWTREGERARELFPDVDPRFFGLHLADADTGTPMHARANASYYLSGGWAAHARQQVAEGRGELLYEGEDPANPDERRYVRTLEEWDALPIHEIERRRASNILTVPVPDLRVFHTYTDEETGQEATSDALDLTATQQAIDAFIDDLIAGWEAAARDLREWIAAEPAGEKPGDEDQTEFARELEGGLRVRAVFAEHDEQPWGEHRPAPRYDVSVTCGDLSYKTSAWGSQADFEEDRHRAREMAFMVLDEMLSAANDPDEFASMATGEEATREQLKRVTALLDAAEEFSDVLTLNQETIEAYR